MNHLHHYLLPLLLLLFSPAFRRLAAADTPSYSADPNAGNINPSLAVIVIVLVLVFLMTGCISLYIHQCSSDSSSAAITTSSAVTAARNGLERSVVETFPTFLYSEVKELKYGKGTTLECAVCLNEFDDDETLRLMPKCDHVFHSECIDAWLEGHATCPVCRTDLRPDPNTAAAPYGSVEEVRVAVVSAAEEEKVSEEDSNLTTHGPGRLRFLRSNSTGHDSVSRPAGEAESGRFTLRLPAEVRRQLVARSKLKRATSQLALPRASSSRRGYRCGGGEGSGSSRYGGGVFGRSMSRLVSFRWAAPSKFRGDEDGGAEGSKGSNSKRALTLGGNAVTPLEGLQSSLPV